MPVVIVIAPKCGSAVKYRFCGIEIVGMKSSVRFVRLTAARATFSTRELKRC